MAEKNLEILQRKRALKLRDRLKARKPEFRRQESWRYKRIGDRWKKPDGIDSKMRYKLKGWPKHAGIGYGSPKETRGLHPSGYREVIVRNIDDLSKINAKTEAIRIAHTVGMKKRAEISVRANEKAIHILNPLPEMKPEEEAAEKKESTEAKPEKETKAQEDAS
jgi:large subunit ribosomal protein L32e